MNEICMIGEHEYIFITKRFKICKKCGVMLKSDVSVMSMDFGKTIWKRIGDFNQWHRELLIDIENEKIESEIKIKLDDERDKALKWLGENK